MFRSEGIVEWGNAAVQGERRAVDVRVYFDSWAIFTFVLLSRATNFATMSASSAVSRLTCPQDHTAPQLAR
jgi:hypothetical protein